MILGVTVASRYAEALMLRAKNRGLALIVVEGASDSRIYRRVLTSRASHILWLNGKKEVLELTAKFESTRVSGSIGIVDADMDRLHGKKRQSTQIVWTSETDIETMVLRSDAYFRAVREPFDLTVAEANRRSLFESSLQLGCIRALSQLKMWKMDFKALDFEAFVDRVRITSDLSALCQEVLRKNPQMEIKLADLEEEVIYFRGQLVDDSFVYHGHDLCHILQLCGSRIFGLRGVGFETISSLFAADDFRKTSTYAEIVEWERINTSFSILELTVPEREL